ncbi:MAG: Ig-like domain-containing protein [Gallionella sp.]|nr:Ig-like domain-containing protein [Gallionella sp.]
MRSRNIFFLCAIGAILTGCGAGTQGSGTATGATAMGLTIATSKTTLKSDNSESATITVTALSSGNVVAPGIPINFSADGGSLSAPSAVTDANGQASVSINPGSANQGNRTVTVSATASGVVTPVLAPIQITGSGVTLSTGATTLIAGGASTTLTVTAVNAGNVGVFNAPVTFSVSPPGAVTITPASGNTDGAGRLSVAVAGVTSGSATVVASALGATATQTYTVSASGSEFKITSPGASPAPLTTVTGSLIFTVQVGASGAANVRFSATIGTWTGCASGTGTSVCTVAAATPTATLVSGVAGLANVQVEGLNGSGNVLVTDARTVAITSAATAATSIIVQANVNVIPPSSGGTANTAAITATVRDINGQPVGNVPVVFTLVDSTGGGETLSPVLAMTSDGTTPNLPLQGQAKTTFTSGSLPSGESGVGITATVVGTALADTTRVNIGGTAGSIFIGMASKITVPSIVTYALPMALLVADSNGNPVPGAIISLSVWPSQYRTGGYYRITPFTTTTDPATGITTITSGTLYCATNVTGIDPATNFIQGGPGVVPLPNEDTNENLILDAGEDANGDVLLTPPNSSAGVLPTTVTADSSGIANFDLTYLKQSASWITVRMRARALVQGSESTSSFTFTLPAEVTDVSSCALPDSPFN